MKAKRINLETHGVAQNAVSGHLPFDSVVLRVKRGPGDETPRLQIVPMMGGKEKPGMLMIPWDGLAELAQSIGSMDDELAKTPWDEIPTEGGSDG